MSSRISIALDAMGGDKAPGIVIAGAEIARERFPHVDFIFFGDEQLIKPLLSPLKALAACSKIRHTDVIISSDDKPGQALRNGRASSMRLAIDAVKNGEAAAIVFGREYGCLNGPSQICAKDFAGN